jgi:ADP-ribosylglycohydrolase
MLTTERHELQKRFVGVLIGTAVGDALGLPAEGLRRSALSNAGVVSGGTGSSSAMACGVTTPNTQYS